MDGENLGVPHLERLWARTAGAGSAAPPTAAEWQADRLVIDGLGLGLQDALRFLHGSAPSFEAFAAWVLERNGGALAPAQVASVNAAVDLALGRRGSERSSASVGPVLEEAELKSFDDNGYVVVHQAVPAESCRAAAQAIWDYLGMDPEAPDTWYDASRCEGVMITLSHHPAFDANRNAPRLRAAFVELWGTSELQVSTDRGGFNPPETADCPFRGAGLHWDTSLQPPIPFQLEGVLYLTDTPAEQGAFRCVPGFHRRIEEWLEALPPGSDPRAQDLSGEAQRIAGKAGDLVIWRSALPHGASPNRGARPRLVQYITCYPPGQVDDRPWV